MKRILVAAALGGLLVVPGAGWTAVGSETTVDAEDVYGSTLARIDRLFEELPADRAVSIRQHADRLLEQMVEFEERQDSEFAEFRQRQQEALDRYERTGRLPDRPPPEQTPPAEPVPVEPTVPPVDEPQRIVRRDPSAGFDPPLQQAEPDRQVRAGRAELTADQERALIAEGIQRFSQAIETASRRYDLNPQFLLCIMKIESAYDIDAVSRAGALGLMQLMPTTADGLGVNPYDLTENILGGARLFDELLQRYSGDVTLAAAAYNAGPTAVERHDGVPPFAETRGYVDRVNAECGDPR